MAKATPIRKGRNQYTKLSPSDYREDWADAMREAAANGATFAELRLLLGGKSPMGKSTWLRLRREDPEFEIVVKDCQELAEIWYNRKVRQSIDAGKDINATALIWLGKNKFGWTDRMDVNQKTEINDITDRPKSEKVAKIQQLLDKAQGKADGTGDSD